MTTGNEYGSCVKCGAALIPGMNWYTNKPDKVCCNCSKWPVYRASSTRNVRMYGNDDPEEAILARQDSWTDD